MAGSLPTLPLCDASINWLFPYCLLRGEMSYAFEVSEHERWGVNCTMLHNPLQFKELSHAYEVLADDKKRQLYDEGGEEALKEGGMGGHSSPMDIFDMFFGGGRRRGEGRERKGRDTVHALRVRQTSIQLSVCACH